MEVVPTSNLVSSETEKPATACNFQHDYTMIVQIESYAYYKYEPICSFLIAETFKSALRNTYTKQLNQNRPAKS